jgi:hypothetical protein
MITGAAYINSSLLMQSMVAMLLPSASTGRSPGTNKQEEQDILATSHGVRKIIRYHTLFV